MVILEDASADRYVAVGETRGIYFPHSKLEEESFGNAKVILVELRAVLYPEILLPVCVINDSQRVVCCTLGEDLNIRVAIWWKERDTLVTNGDGICIVP
jgi:hypothetical protein